MTPTYILIGLGGGLLAGLFGIGGGIVIVPALMMMARMPLITATGTSLSALLLPVGALGAYEYWRRGHVDTRAALLIALGLFVGAYFGARIALQLEPTVLRRVFAVALVAVATRMWFSA